MDAQVKVKSQQLQDGDILLFEVPQTVGFGQVLCVCMPADICLQPHTNAVCGLHVVCMACKQARTHAHAHACVLDFVATETS
jgi:hypothetical protein